MLSDPAPATTPAPLARSPRARLRWAAADIVAMVVFSMAVGMAIELGVAGLTLAESLRARAFAVPINLATGRPYGAFRDRILVAVGAIDVRRSPRSRRVRTVVGDTVSFVLFQVPLYACVLLLSGASIGQAAVACATMSAVFAVSGRPFGVLLDATRRLFRVGAPAPAG